MGALDGLTILRYGHAYDSGGGGVEQYLADLNRVLSQRSSGLRTIQMEWTRRAETTAENEERIGDSTLRHVPILVGHDPLEGEVSLTEHRWADSARKVKEAFCDHVLFAPPVERLVTQTLSRWRRVPRQPGEPDGVGRKAAELLQRYPTDLVVLHTAGGADAMEMIEAARAAGVPVVIVHHFSNDRLRGVSMRQQIAAVAGVAGVSWVGVPEFLKNKFCNVSDSVDPALYSPALARPLGRDFPTPVLFAPARVTPTKGQAEVLQVAALLKRRGLATQVIFAGRVDSPEFEKELHRQVEELGLSGTVEFLGQITVETLRDWYAAVCVVLFPTHHHEGMPRMLVDCQAMGAPPVVYDIGGTREGVRDGETGFLIPLGDVEAFARAVERLLREPDLHPRMSTAGQKFVRENFSLEAFADRHERFYREALLPGTAAVRPPAVGAAMNGNASAR